jgi:hypothetical protein
VLVGRLGLAVFPIWSRPNVAPTPDLGIATRAAVFGVEALATAAGRGTGRGTILAMARGGMSPDISASCRSTNAVFIGSMGAVRRDGSACVSICSGDAAIPAVGMVSRGCGSTRCATSLTTVPGDGWGAAPGMEASGVGTSERFVFSSCGLAGPSSEIVAISGGGGYRRKLCWNDFGALQRHQLI